MSHCRVTWNDGPAVAAVFSLKTRLKQFQLAGHSSPFLCFWLHQQQGILTVLKLISIFQTLYVLNIKIEPGVLPPPQKKNHNWISQLCKQAKSAVLT